MELNIAEISTDGIKQRKKVDFSKKVDYVEIALEDMSLEDYIKYKKFKEERNKRVYKKMGYEYDER